MEFDLETMNLETVRKSYPKEFEQELKDNDEYLFDNDEYNELRQTIQHCERRVLQSGLFYAQGHWDEEISYDNPMRYDFPDNVFSSFSYRLTHILYEEAFTRHQNLLLTSLYEDLQENIAWFYRYPNLIILSEDIKPYLYRFVEEMEYRLNTQIISWSCKSPEESSFYKQDIAWAYKPDEEINPEPWARQKK